MSEDEWAIRWDALDACLAESLHTDYSDLRGSPPETVSSRRFVELRRTALDHLATHHLSGNYDVTVDGDHGRCRASMMIWRRDDGGRVLNTHCLYEFELSKSAGGWRISSITQKVLWNDGDWAIHAGIPRA